MRDVQSKEDNMMERSRPCSYLYRMRSFGMVLFCLLITSYVSAQLSKDAIQTDVVLHEKRKSFDKYLHEQTIRNAFAQPLDSNTEYLYESACWAISQFMLQSQDIETGFSKMFAQYDSLQYSAKRAFLEAVYTTYPSAYIPQIALLLEKETVPKLFAMESLYLMRTDPSLKKIHSLQKALQQRFQNNDSLVLLQELKKYFISSTKLMKPKTPSIPDLFAHQNLLHQKIIYSFQRWNRDYPGIAILQYEDGGFAKDSAGKLVMFQQLARSASDLPYFITDGNTPQGIFSITGIDIAHNNFIGPTPNIQMVMPFEADSIFWHTPYDSTKEALTNYLDLLPVSWQTYEPITEAFYAGKAGRSEIIAHGTTIDPEYFKDKPYYPLTPTLGCLCAKEIWNIFNGKLLESDQYNLVKAFIQTPSDTGYVFVINVDDQQKAVSREEVQQWVKLYEAKLKNNFTSN